MVFEGSAGSFTGPRTLERLFKYNSLNNELLYHHVYIFVVPPFVSYVAHHFVAQGSKGFTQDFKIQRQNILRI